MPFDMWQHLKPLLMYKIAQQLKILFLSTQHATHQEDILFYFVKITFIQLLVVKRFTLV